MPEGAGNTEREVHSVEAPDPKGLQEEKRHLGMGAGVTSDQLWEGWTNPQAAPPALGAPGGCGSATLLCQAGGRAGAAAPAALPAAFPVKGFGRDS